MVFASGIGLCGEYVMAGEKIVNEFKTRYIKCRQNKDSQDIDELIEDIIRYLLNNKWSFVLNTVPLGFTVNDMQVMVVIDNRDMDDGFIQQEGFLLDKISGECDGLDEIIYADKMDFVKKVIPLIPVLE